MPSGRSAEEMAEINKGTRFNGKTAVENGKKGAIASAKAKREKRSMREWVEFIGNLPSKDGALRDAKCGDDLPNVNMTMDGDVVAKLYAMAKAGNPKAIDMIMKLKGAYAPTEMIVRKEPEQMSEEDLDALIAKEQERK